MEGFEGLIPDDFLPALEEALNAELTPLIRSFPSYINRVYEIRTADDVPFVAKFYRPGRWTAKALQDEHTFLFDCEEAEIPVVCPLKLKNGKSLGSFGGIPFAVFPKKAGRQFDGEAEESWSRLGVLLGRLHAVGQKRKAPARLFLTPEATTRVYVDQLAGDAVSEKRRQAYRDIGARIIDAVTPCFEGMECIRIHGDFHRGNILDRPDTGLLVIDFDDMMNGPPVQDFWLLLPDHYPACKPQLDLLTAGYGQFRDIHPRSGLLIEGLRAMRMIYFTAWVAMQRGDAQFQARFPDFGTDSFWIQEINDLRAQYSHMMEALIP